MRGEDRVSGVFLSYVDLEARGPWKHPLRAMRDLVNASLGAMDASFSALYKAEGRPSIPPERLLRATLLQMLYTVRSERQLVERLEFDLLFRWFVGLGIDDAVFDASVFSRNRNHLLTTDIAREFLSTLLALNLKDGATLSVDQGYDAASFVEVLKRPQDRVSRRHSRRGVQPWKGARHGCSPRRGGERGI